MTEQKLQAEQIDSVDLRELIIGDRLEIAEHEWEVLGHEPTPCGRGLTLRLGLVEEESDEAFTEHERETPLLGPSDLDPDLDLAEPVEHEFATKEVDSKWPDRAQESDPREEH